MINDDSSSDIRNLRPVSSINCTLGIWDGCLILSFRNISHAINGLEKPWQNLSIQKMPLFFCISRKNHDSRAKDFGSLET